MSLPFRTKLVDIFDNRGIKTNVTIENEINSVIDIQYKQGYVYIRQEVVSFDLPLLKNEAGIKLRRSSKILLFFQEINLYRETLLRDPDQKGAMA